MGCPVLSGMQPMALNASHGGHMKYPGEHGGAGGHGGHNDTFQDFVSLVCQEANNPQGQVSQSNPIQSNLIQSNLIQSNPEKT